MSAPQAAAITACTACAAVGGAAAGGAFSSGSAVDENHDHEELNPNSPTTDLPSSSSTPEEEPKWFPLSDEIATASGAYDSKIGKEYGHLFVGTYGTEGKATDKWWKKSYEKYTSDKETGQGKTVRTFSEGFGDTKVTQAFDGKEGSVTTALNKVCDSAYKKTKDNEVTIFYKANPSEEKDKLREDLWRYCSPLGASPINLEAQTNTYTNGKIGHTKKEVLLSAKDDENQVLWALKHKEFYDLSDVNDNFFKELFKTNKENNKANKNSFKEKCKAAYEKQATGGEATNPSADIVEKYCSLKPIKPA